MSEELKETTDLSFSNASESDPKTDIAKSDAPEESVSETMDSKDSTDSVVVNPVSLNIGLIARVCHEVNRAYCESIGDNSQLSFDEAPEWQIMSAISGVEFHIKNPDAGKSGSHENWMREKLADGWQYGEVKDTEKKTHPCLVPYDELSKEQQVKDALFVAIVKSFL